MPTRNERILMDHIRSRRRGHLLMITLALLLALVTVACGADDTDQATGGTTTEKDGGGRGATIGVSFYDNKVIPLYIDMEQGMKAKAKELGATVSFSYANFDPAAQVDQIQQYITQQVDVILVTPFDRNALVPAYEAAREADIPIISFANKVDDQYEDLFVGRDWSEMGSLEMEAIAKHLNGQGKVALIAGPPEIDVARQVSEGWHGVLDKNPGLEVVAELTDPDMTREKGLDLANTLLAANRDVQAIACTIDQICLGAVQAIEEQGLSQGDIFVAALDADTESVEQVKAGNGMDFTIGMKGVTWGRQVIEVAVDHLDGKKSSEHMVESRFVVVDGKSSRTLTEQDLK
jgi:ABC-type sugar transport system substrate-binding protein